MTKINPRATAVSAPRSHRAHVDVMSFTGRIPSPRCAASRPAILRPTGRSRRRGCSAARGSRRAPIVSSSLHDVAGDMPQPPGQLMPLHGRADRSGDDQSDLRRICRCVVAAAPHIDDQVGLHGSSSVLHRGIEVGGPRHAVPRGKHRCDTGLGNQAVSERRPLRRRSRHDRPPRPGAHPQPEAVHAGTAPVIRLEGPLALCHDSLLVASGIVLRPGTPCRWVTIALTKPR